MTPEDHPHKDTVKLSPDLFDWVADHNEFGLLMAKMAAEAATDFIASSSLALVVDKETLKFNVAIYVDNYDSMFIRLGSLEDMLLREKDTDDDTVKDLAALLRKIANQLEE